MSVLEELIHEINEMVLPLWVFLQSDEMAARLFTVIREALTWTTEGQRGNAAV